MTQQDWMIVLGVGGVASQAVAGFVVIKVATAVLEERLNGHRTITTERFKAHDERLSAHDREIQRLRDWRHDEVSPMLQAHEGRIAILEEQEG